MFKRRAQLLAEGSLLASTYPPGIVLALALALRKRLPVPAFGRCRLPPAAPVFECHVYPGPSHLTNNPPPLPGLLCDLLWSDPDRDIIGWGENDRGVSFTFGEDIVRDFLAKHDLDLICRAHQVRRLRRKEGRGGGRAGLDGEAASCLPREFQSVSCSCSVDVDVDADVELRRRSSCLFVSRSRHQARV